MKCRDYMARYLYKMNINTIKPYENSSLLAKTYFGYKGDCPITEDLEKRILIIPGYYRLGDNDISKVAQSINAGFKEYNLKNDQ